MNFKEKWRNSTTIWHWHLASAWIVSNDPPRSALQQASWDSVTKWSRCWVRPTGCISKKITVMLWICCKRSSRRTHKPIRRGIHWAWCMRNWETLRNHCNFAWQLLCWQTTMICGRNWRRNPCMCVCVCGASMDCVLTWLQRVQCHWSSHPLSLQSHQQWSNRCGCYLGPRISLQAAWRRDKSHSGVPNDSKALSTSL